MVFIFGMLRSLSIWSSTVYEYIKYKAHIHTTWTPTREHNATKRPSYISILTILNCALTHQQTHRDLKPKMSSSVACSHNRFSILAEPSARTYTSTQRHADHERVCSFSNVTSQMTNVFSPFCLLALLSKERRSRGGEDMFQRDQWMNYDQRFLR